MVVLVFLKLIFNFQLYKYLCCTEFSCTEFFNIKCTVYMLCFRYFSKCWLCIYPSWSSLLSSDVRSLWATAIARFWFLPSRCVRLSLCYTLSSSWHSIWWFFSNSWCYKSWASWLCYFTSIIFSLCTSEYVRFSITQYSCTTIFLLFWFLKFFMLMFKWFMWQESLLLYMSLRLFYLWI